MKRRTYPASLIILALAGAIVLVFIAALIAFVVAAILTTPAKAAPAGQLSVVVATCNESVAIWQDVPAGLELDGGDYISGVVLLNIHGHEYPVEMYWQFVHYIPSNNRAVFQAIDWQTVALQSEGIEIGGGWLWVDGVMTEELSQAGTKFLMDCRHVYMPMMER